MFKFDSKELGVDLMADRNSKISQVIQVPSAGNYSFTCGLIGGSETSNGQIIVK